MAKLSDKKKLLVICTSAVLLTGLAGGGVWWAKGLVEEQRVDIGRMREEIAAAQQKIDKTPKLETEVIVLRECVREYVKILPEVGELNNFVKSTSQFFQQSGVRFKKLVPGQNQAGGKGSKFDRYTYTIDAEATLWQFLKLLNSFENYERFVAVRNFSLAAANVNQNAEAFDDVRHSVSLTVETYVYTGGRAGKDVTIANYANKKAGLREEIYRQIQSLKTETEKYDFKDARGRRDIFVDPRPSGVGDAPGGAIPVPEQKKIIERLTLEVGKLRTLFQKSQDAGITIIERMEFTRTVKTGLDQLQLQVDEITSKGMVSYQPYRLRWAKEVVDPLEKLKKDLVESGPKKDKNLSDPELKALFTAMKEDLINGEPDQCKQRFDSVQDRLDVTKQDPRYKTVMAVRGLYLRAQVALEFAQKKLEIKGVCVTDDGRSGMILNGEVVQEGDYIDQDLFVKAVGREQVEFVYKGFTLVKTW